MMMFFFPWFCFEFIKDSMKVKLGEG